MHAAPATTPPAAQPQRMGRWRYRLLLLLAGMMGSAAGYLNVTAFLSGGLPDHVRIATLALSVGASVLVSHIIGRRMGFSDYARGALTAAATISTSVLGMALHFPDVALWMVLVPIPVLLFVLRFLAFWR